MASPNNVTQIYSLLVSGERFELTKDQLQSDPGNYFATFFLGDFSEAQNGCTELVISKEPRIFELIHAHLRGYTVLPLSPSSVPPYMTPETALINLMADAQYYGLQMLVEKIEQFRVEEERKRGIVDTTARTRKRYKFAVGVEQNAPLDSGLYNDRAVNLYNGKFVISQRVASMLSSRNDSQFPH
jgi:hypothetical protein